MIDDPLLPPLENIKPTLYYFDEYQTYDLIMVYSVWTKIQDAIKQIIGFTYDPIYDCCNILMAIPKYQYSLIERFTPFDLFLEEYSLKIYNFFKQFAGTGIKNNQFLSGENHPVFPVVYPNSFSNIYKVIECFNQ